jgi:hypothetical protein
MKKTFILITAIILAVVPGYAQRDIKAINKVSDAQLRKILGNPEKFEEEPLECYYFYKNATVVITKKTRILESFQTDSPDYCILTKYISGGIKVGDSISKLQKINFAKTDYGRNNTKNALTFIPDAPEGDYNYSVFEREFKTVYFRIENGIIKEWMLDTKEDTPYEPYNYSISFW